LGRFALKSSDGSVWAWGTNANGSAGDNTAAARSSPVSVVGGHSFNVIAAGTDTSFALKSSDGSLWSWGLNTNDQLGDGTIINRSSPVSVIGGHSFIKVAGSGTSTYALKADGSVWAWGKRTSGGLGNNTANSIRSPEQVVGPSGGGSNIKTILSVVYSKGSGGVFNDITTGTISVSGGGTSQVKTVNGVTVANVKTINGNT